MSVGCNHLAATYTDTSRRYFGRAKELPGVKDLFESRKKEEDEDVATTAFYKRFTGQGPSYFGDLDEADGELLAFERKAEEEGGTSTSGIFDFYSLLHAEYEEACAAIRTALGLGEGAPMPPLRPWLSAEAKAPAPKAKPKGKQVKKKKRQAKGDDADDKMDEDPKLPLADINRHIPFLNPEHLQPPKMPTKEELDRVLLGLRKQALLEEYLGDT